MEAYEYSANYYDRLLSPFIQPIRQRVLVLVKKYHCKTILDVCCGTGDQLKLLKKHGVDAEGINLSDAMLHVAQKGDEDVNCLHQDATQMHYTDAKFDLTMTTFALHEKEAAAARKIIEEMLRVTQEGKNILIVDYELGENTSFLSKTLIYFTEWIAGKEHYRNFKSFIQKGGLPNLLANTPVKEIERHYFGQHGIVLILLRKEGM